MQSLLTKLLAVNRTARQSFHLIVVPHDDWPSCETYQDVDQLIAAIRRRVGSECHLYPVMGERLRITTGNLKYLKTPFGSLPLFDVDEQGVVDGEEDGWVGSNMSDEVDESDEEELLPAPSAAAESEFEEGDTPGITVDDSETPVF